jgi:Bacterial lectin
MMLASLRSARPRAIGPSLALAVGVLMAVWLLLPAAASAHVKSRWQTVGSAALQDGRLVLTESVGGQAGAAWQVPAVKLPPRFQATFDFSLSQPMGAADGFAFVIQGAAGDALGGAGGGIGYTGIPNSVAVEFDTWPNSAGDFGSPTSVADPSVPHISVHTRGPEPNDVDEQYSLGATTDVPPLSDGARHSVTISYKRHALSVTLDGQPKLSVPINIRERLELRHRRVWFGFTAATGDATQRHEILSYRLKRGAGCYSWRSHKRMRFASLVRSDGKPSQCADVPKVREDPPAEDVDSPSGDWTEPPTEDKTSSPAEDKTDSRSEDWGDPRYGGREDWRSGDDDDCPASHGEPEPPATSPPSA